MLNSNSVNDKTKPHTYLISKTLYRPVYIFLVQCIILWSFVDHPICWMCIFQNIGETVFISLYSLEMFKPIVLRRVKQFKIHTFIEKIDVWIKNPDRLDRFVVLKKWDFKLCCKLNTIAACIAFTQIKERERVIMNPNACRILRGVHWNVTRAFKTTLSTSDDRKPA